MTATLTTEAEIHEPPVVKVADSDLPVVRDRIAKANRRLAKAGITERFELVVGEAELVEVRDEFTKQVTARYHRHAVELVTPAIGYSGWTFVATLNFEQGGTVVRTVPGQACSYRPTDKVCDHCGTARERTETFVVVNADGEFKQLGRNCLELFFGIKPVLWVLGADYLSDLDDERGSFTRAVETESVVNIVAAALAATNGGLGYVSKAAAESGDRLATSMVTWNVLYERPTGRDRAEREAELRELREAAAGYLADGTVAKVIEAAQAITGDSEYADNIRVLAASEFVGVKNIGFVASFVAVYARANRVAAEAKTTEAKPVSQHIGSVGDKKVVTTGAITGLRTIDSAYGTTLLVEWTTVEGNVCKWFASNWYQWSEDGQHGVGVVNTPIEIGTTITVTGTVKKHEEYKGTKATQFTRCTLAVA